MESWEEFAVVGVNRSAKPCSSNPDPIPGNHPCRRVVAIPDQPEWLFGSELIALAVAGGATLFILDRRAHRHRSPQPVAQLLDVLSPNLLTMTVSGVGGLLTAIGVEWGLYLEVPAVIAALLGGVIGAWLFMMRTGESDSIADNA
jgi:hypothetical protein